MNNVFKLPILHFFWDAKLTEAWPIVKHIFSLFYYFLKYTTILF